MITEAAGELHSTLEFDTMLRVSIEGPFTILGRFLSLTKKGGRVSWRHSDSEEASYWQS